MAMTTIQQLLTTAEEEVMLKTLGTKKRGYCGIDSFVFFTSPRI